MKKNVLLFIAIMMTFLVNSQEINAPSSTASPVPFDGYINVQLTDEAVAGMSIRIVPVVNAVSPIEQSIADGSSSVIVSTSGLPAGQYVLSLMHNNLVIHSLNIYKAY